MINKETTPYHRLGGESAVRQLVDRFYDLMSQLPEAKTVRDLHPGDLTVSRDKLFKFLSGWLGGPPLYIEEFGHPRLRARHLSFVIGKAERDTWMLCMTQAMQEFDIDELMKSHLLQQLGNTATFMMNRNEPNKSND